MSEIDDLDSRDFPTTDTTKDKVIAEQAEQLAELETAKAAVQNQVEELTKRQRAYGCLKVAYDLSEAETKQQAEKIEEMQKEMDTKNMASSKQLDNLWKDVVLAKRPDYGDWEYPAQAYRHIMAEFNDLKAENKRLKERLKDSTDWLRCNLQGVETEQIIELNERALAAQPQKGDDNE